MTTVINPVEFHGESALQELADDEPQVILLDDVLVETDPVRQDRVHDVLGAQADRLQILILTYQPDRYRSVGESLTLTASMLQM